MMIKTMLRNRSVLLYGIALAILLLLMKWLEWRIVVIDHALELYAAAVAILFTGLGIWLAKKLHTPKTNTVIVERQVLVRTDRFVVNQAEVSRLRLSNRELEVLQLMADGLSNLQIADRLFISLNTIKTHSSRIFEKLEVKRRTQAIEIGRKRSIIS